LKTLTIGQLAKKTQVNVETVRYYERRELLPEPPRRDSGYRIYSNDDVKRIQFIKSAKELGFTLTEILELFSLRVDPDTSCEDVKELADTKISDIEKKIEDLGRMKQALTKLSIACHGKGPTGECPILDALEGEDNDE